MKKFVYFCLICFIAFSVVTCERDTRIAESSENAYTALSVNKDVQTDAGAKCPPCSEETAWAAGGGSYNVGGRGNWATYIKYKEERLVSPIYAGQYMYMGLAIFTPDPLSVHVDIIMFGGEWCFQDVSEPIKIEGYDNNPPTGNPKVGLFTYKFTPVFESMQMDGPMYHVGIVDVHDFYGVHLDVGCCD